MKGRRRTTGTCVHEVIGRFRGQKARLVFSADALKMSDSVPAVAVLQSLPLFDRTRLFSLPLPQSVGFSVSFSFSLRLYLLLLFFGETETDRLANS